MSKRRRTNGMDASPGGRTLIITNLPVEALTHVANYLAAPSRVLFDIALFGNDTTLNAEGSNSAIVGMGSQWGVLDFGEIEKNLATKLSDDNVQQVLMRIDAVNNLKRLKLTNCVNITGAGLEPLSGSTIIEQIDLSLAARHQSPILVPEPTISCDIVLPILDSIIQREGCSLKHLQFPHVWRKDRSTESGFHAFLGRYNEMWENRGLLSCLNCNCDLREEGLGGICTEAGECYGEHANACFGCLKHYCYGCTNDDGDDMLACCGHCERDYCIDCKKMDSCDVEHCEENFCEDCKPFVETEPCSASECDNIICYQCVKNSVCSRCDKRWCRMDGCREAPGLQKCLNNDCKEKVCDDCNFDAGVNGVSYCYVCLCHNPSAARWVTVHNASQVEVEKDRIK